jgi:hypothetical protein
MQGVYNPGVHSSMQRVTVFIEPWGQGLAHGFEDEGWLDRGVE